MEQPKKNNYIYGTSAERIQYDTYDIYETNEILKEKKNQRLNRAIKVKYIILIIIGFTSICFISYRYATITNLNYELNKLTKQYENLKSENSKLKVAIEKNTDLSQIKEIAESKLGMQKPDKYQIVYIKVPKSDFTITSSDYKNNVKNNNINDLFSIILNKADIIRKIFTFD